jgi:hypothetical protein
MKKVLTAILVVLGILAVAAPALAKPRSAQTSSDGGLSGGGII